MSLGFVTFCDYFLIYICYFESAGNYLSISAPRGFGVRPGQKMRGRYPTT